MSETDRSVIARARTLAALDGEDALREHTGEADAALAYVRAFGEARHLLGELAAIAARLDGHE